MHGLACVFWANLTPFSLQLLSLASCFAGVVEGLGATHALRGADLLPRFLSMLTAVCRNLYNFSDSILVSTICP